MKKRYETRYDYEDEINELLDDALNELSPEEYDLLLDHISMMLADHGY